MTRYFSLIDRARTPAHRYIYRTPAHRHLFLYPLN
jgi:hypothetical protein